MKRRFLILSLLALAVSAIAGCKKDEPASSFEFSVTDPDGKDIAEIRQFSFGEKVTYKFTAKALKEIHTVAPTGWTATATVGSKSIVVTAPDAKDETAATDGEIKVQAISTGGQAKNVNLKVAVVDANISYLVKNLTSPVKFHYGETLDFEAESSNVESVTVEAPAGWTVSATASKVTLTAPAKSDDAAVASGKVTLKPKSARGSLGSLVEFNVEVLVNAPVLAFDATSLARVEFGKTVTVDATVAENVSSVTVASIPQGWTAAYTVDTKKLAVTAPAFDAESDAAGKIELVAKSASNDELRVEVPVGLVGINSIEDIVALVAGASPVPFVYNNEVVLNCDLDLTGLTQNIIIPELKDAALNGRNRTITLGISTSDGSAALVGTLDNVSIKNLRIAGSVVSTGGTANQIFMSALAKIAKGASFENVSNYATLTQTGTNGDSWGFVGGLVADVQGDCSFKNCHNYGKIICSSPKYCGGIVGDIWDKTKGLVDGCSNEADITFNFKGLDSGNMMAGGVIGNAKGANWTFKNSFNKGNITYDVKDKGVRALGGFIGMAQGSFENCYNTGNITNKDYQNSSAGTRRIGGFAGAVWEDSSQQHYSKNCYNTGNVTDLGRIGGFIGSAEGEAHFDGDYNTGKVLSVSTVGLTEGTAGFCGHSCDDVFYENCSNKGIVICATYRAGAGFCVTADNAKLSKCTNEGIVKVGASALMTGKDWSPLAAGLAAIRGDGSKVTISECKNTGAVTGMGQFECCVQSLYASEGAAHLAMDPAWDGLDATICDQASRDASAGASVTYIPKSSWSDSTVLSWLQ